MSVIRHRRGTGNWPPPMDDARRKALHEAMSGAILALTDAADTLTRYPGGGAPAHLAREAAGSAAAIKAWLNDDPDWLDAR